VDRLVPWRGDVPLGTLVEVLVANRLLQPKALFRVGPWAHSAALTDYYGLTAEQLNDDRLGRALERLAAHAETIQAALVLTAIDRFGIWGTGDAGCILAKRGSLVSHVRPSDKTRPRTGSTFVPGSSRSIRSPQPAVSEIILGEAT
jgi:hypothetical protein